MIELLAGAAKGMTSLLGPVAAYAYRRSGQKFFDASISEYTNPTQKTEARAAQLSRRLRDTGLSQREVVDLAAFCRSDEGDFCFRLIAINSLAGNALNRELVTALTVQVEAMLKLHGRGTVGEHTHTAAAAVVGEGTSAIFEAMKTLKRRDPMLAQELRELAKDQAKLPELLRAQQLKTRASHIDALSELLPSAIASEIAEYCRLTENDYKNLIIASGASHTIAVPIQENVIASTVNYRHGRTFTSALATDRALLPAVLARHRHAVGSRSRGRGWR